MRIVVNPESRRMTETPIRNAVVQCDTLYLQNELGDPQIF